MTDDPTPAIFAVIVAEQEEAAPRMDPETVAKFKRFFDEQKTTGRNRILIEEDCDE